MKIKNIKQLKDIYYQGRWFNVVTTDLILYVDNDSQPHKIVDDEDSYYFSDNDIKFWESVGAIEVEYD